MTEEITRAIGVDAAHCPVLLLNYNGWNDTIAGLTAMQPYVPNIWLIDNRSPDDRLDEVRTLFPQVRVLALTENFGWSGAYNRAIDIAAGEGHDAVYLLNNDAVLRPGALDAALATLRSTSNAAVVGSVMLDDGGNHVFFDGEWHWDSAGSPVALSDDVRDVRSIHGGGFALRLAAYRDVGAFHEPYFLYHEETDWCARAKAAGWRVLVDCASRVDHDGEGSSIGFNRLYYVARNRFLAKSRGIVLRDRPETRLSIVEYEILEGARLDLARRAAVVSGLIDGLLGRFGPRRASALAFAARPLALVLPVAFRARRKIAHVFGRSGRSEREVAR